MSNLIPEQRPDKNGNLVTRWVRSFGKRDSAKVIPALATPALRPLPKEREQQVQDLAVTLRDSLAFGKGSSIEPSLEKIARHDPELLDRMTAAIKADPEFQRQFWAEMFGNKHLVIDSSPKQLEDLLEKFRATFAVTATLHDISESSGDLRQDVFSALKMNDVVHSITRGKVTENFDETMSAVTAVAFVKGLHLDSAVPTPDGKPVAYADVWNEAQYIVSRADEVEPILPELTRRGTIDSGTIDILLDSPTQTLQEGSL